MDKQAFVVGLQIRCKSPQQVVWVEVIDHAVQLVVVLGFEQSVGSKFNPNAAVRERSIPTSLYDKTR